MPNRVLVAYYYPVVLQALKELVQQQGLSLVAETCDVRKAGELARETRPHLVILDFQLPYADGLAAARAVHEASPGSRCILMTRHTEEEHVLAALRLGIKGYFLKTEQPEQLVETIRAVSAGAVCFSPRVSAPLMPRIQGPAGRRDEERRGLIAWRGSELLICQA